MGNQNTINSDDVKQQLKLLHQEIGQRAQLFIGAIVPHLVSLCEKAVSSYVIKENLHTQKLSDDRLSELKERLKLLISEMPQSSTKSLSGEFIWKFCTNDDRKSFIDRDQLRENICRATRAVFIRPMNLLEEFGYKVSHNSEYLIKDINDVLRREYGFHISPHGKDLLEIISLPERAGALLREIEFLILTRETLIKRIDLLEQQEERDKTASRWSDI